MESTERLEERMERLLETLAIAQDRLTELVSDIHEGMARQETLLRGILATLRGEKP
jgi:hypothetical protein